MTTALLVIDVQNTLCTGQYAAFDVAALIERINQLSQHARQLQVPVVLIQHEEDGAMAFDSPGWQLPSQLITSATDIRLRKTACDAFHNTKLREILEQKDVKHLIICGMQSEYCVDATVRRALSFGYNVDLVSDGHTTLDNGVLTAAQIIAHTNQTFTHMQSYGVKMKVSATNQVLQSLG